MDKHMEEVDAKRLATRRVLIVDDDPDILAILKQAMQSEGALTQCCSDGNSGGTLRPDPRPSPNQEPSVECCADGWTSKGK